MRFLTVLPAQKHDNSPTAHEVEVTVAMLRSSGVKVRATAGCIGLWYDNDGRLYQDPGTLLMLEGSEAAMRVALAFFGQAAGQKEVLFVERQPDASHILGMRDNGFDGACELAKAHGGATLLPSGLSLSYDYAALVAGVDYAESELTHI